MTSPTMRLSPAHGKHSPRIPAGFSLVEVVMALGIMSFALMGLIGLLPAGLSQFRQAIDQTVKAQITQELTAMAQRTDYGDLSAFGTAGSPTIYYYDSEGAKLAGSEKDSHAYKAEIYLADAGRLLRPTWAAVPVDNVRAVGIRITSRTAPDRPHTSITYVANSGS